MKYNSHLWAGASKSALDFVDRIQSRALKLIGDDRVASSVLFYKYYFGKCSSGLSELIPPPQMAFGRSHAFIVATMSHRTTHYRVNSFFTRTAGLCNDLPANIFAECFNIEYIRSKGKSTLSTIPYFYLIYVSILLLYLFFFKPMQCNAFIGGYPLRHGFAIKKKNI